MPKAVEKSVWDALAVRDAAAPIVINRKGHPEPDPVLRESENVRLPGPVERFDSDPTEMLASGPYRDAVETHMTAEVLPHIADAWVDHSKSRVGYEIPFTRLFYRYQPPRPLDEIDADIHAVADVLERTLAGLTQ